MDGQGQGQDGRGRGGLSQPSTVFRDALGSLCVCAVRKSKWNFAFATTKVYSGLFFSTVWLRSPFARSSLEKKSSRRNLIREKSFLSQLATQK